MPTLVNRAKVSTGTTGTGTITLGSAVSGFQTFAAAGVSNGDTVRYVIEDGTSWEIGTGTYSSTGPTLTRTVSESSAGGSALNLSGSAEVFIAATSADTNNWDTAYGWGDHSTEGYLTGNQTITLTGDASGSGTTSIAVTVADDSHNHVISNVDGLQAALDAKLDDSQKGAANGLAELDGSGKVPSSQLPSYVDDVLEYANSGAFPGTGETGKIYIALDTNDVYRWTGSAYVKVSDAVSTADEANTLATARTISLTGDVSGSTSFDGSANVSITATVADDSHNHVISNVDGLQTALDSKQAAATALTTSTTFGGDVSGTYNSIVVADDSHNHVISNVDGLQTALDGKLSLSGGTLTGALNVTDLDVSGAFTSQGIDDNATATNLTLSGGSGSQVAEFAGRVEVNGVASSATSASNALAIKTDATLGHALMIQESGAADGEQWALGVNSDGSLEFYDSSTATPIVTFTDNAPANSMTLDSSGNLLVGKTAASLATQGVMAVPSGYLSATRSGSSAAYFNRTTDNGAVVEIRQSNITIGTLGTLGNEFQIKSNGSGNLSLNRDVDDPTDIFRETANSADQVLRIITNVGGTDTVNLSVKANGDIETNGGITLAGNTVFHDGYHPNADKWTTARTLSLTGDVTGSVSWDGSGNASLTATAEASVMKRRGTITTEDWNTFIDSTESGYYQVNSGSGANRPSTYNWGGLINWSSNGAQKFQIYAPHNGTDSSVQYGIWARTGWNTDYDDWAEIWTSQTDGSGSGLDADLLDGQQGSYYAPIASPTFTGTVKSSNAQEAFRADAASAYLRLGDGTNGHSGFFSSRYQTDSSNLQYGTYWAYDCYWNESTNQWNASRTNLGNKWKAEMGYHLNRFKLSYFNGVVSSPWADSAWSDVFEVSSNGTVTVYNELIPDADNTGAVGTSARTWANGQFTNLTVDSTLSVRGAVDLADGDILRLGSSDDWEFFHDGTHNYMDCNVGDLYIRQGTTYRYLFDVSTGNFHADGNIIAYSTSVSDARLKEDVAVLESPLEIIDQLRGVTFTRIDEQQKSSGVIAQELEKVMPWAIREHKARALKDDDTLYKTVEYDALSALFIESIKELKAEVLELKRQLAEKD